MRTFSGIALMLLVSAGLASAQISRGNVFFGYSYYNTYLQPNQRGALNGFQASLEGRILPFVGIVADFNSNYGTLANFTPAGTCAMGMICSSPSVSVHQENSLFGPRVSFPAGKFRPFAEALFGAAFMSTNGFGSDTSLATAYGGGIDYRIVPHIGWRVQADYVRSSLFSRTEGNARISTGIVLRF